MNHRIRTFMRRLVSVLTIAVPLLLGPVAHAQPAAVQRGEYLARAGDCISCHTANGGVPFGGGYRLDTPFGALLAPNITPDPQTGIGLWSADDFYRVMHDGVNRRGQDMYPAMPYDFYTRITREDSDAIYAYMRTLKPVVNAVQINQLRFPFNQRWSMAVWRELYFTPGTFKPDTAKSASWNRGAYLVEGLGHCSSCHSPRNALGGIEKDKAYTGASIDGWFALNLSSNLHTGLGSWTAAEIATYLKTGAVRRQHHGAGPDGRGGAQQHVLFLRCGPGRHGRVPEVDPAEFLAARRKAGSRPHPRPGGHALHGPLRRLPPGNRARHARRVPASGRQPGRDRARCG